MESEAWHKWRAQGIGSSDAPIIMGVSPYSTPFELWELKTGRRQHWDGNWATRRGQALEPRARAHYELLRDCDMPATLVQHPNFSRLRASLDGWNSKERIVLEIKCPGKVDHALALEGEIPEKYYPQVQHQIFVASAVRADYFSFDGNGGAIVEVLFDSEWIREYFPKALAFWECVENDIPPSITERDWKLVRNKSLRQELEAWHSASLVDEEHADYLSRRIFEVFELENRRIKCSGFRIDGLNKRILIAVAGQTQQ